MKITSLGISNIMRVEAAQVIPNSDVTVIQGENEAGKSTLLDSIIFAFCGDRALPEMPIKEGAKKGEIVIKMDGNKSMGIPPFTISRILTNKTRSVKIEPVTVTKGETPRAFLDKLIGSISFDPLKFINEEPKKQRVILLKLLGIDPDEWDKKEKAAFDTRTEANRELKTATLKIKDKTLHTDITETEEIKLGDLSTKLQQAVKFNQDIKNRIDANERLKQSALTNKNKVEDLKAQIIELENLIAKQRDQYKTEKDDLALLFPIDIETINQEISSIESKNIKVRHNKQVRQETTDKDSKQAIYDKADSVLEKIRTDRINLIQSATMPIPGLTVDDTGILYNNIPLHQCSDGAKLMIGVAISMALNPTVRVIQIKDGSLLDKKNMELLKQVVKDKDFQLFIERVNDQDGYDLSGKVGIYIEEGAIKYINGIKVEENQEAATVPVLELPEEQEAAAGLVDDEW